MCELEMNANVKLVSIVVVDESLFFDAQKA
jgi:hypothetical protein